MTIAVERRPGARGSRLWRLALRTCFGVALVVVAVLLLLPSDDLPSTGIWDKLEHALTFAILGVLEMIALPEQRYAWRLPIGLIGFGAICEVLQTWVPGREVSFADGLANAVGVLTAAALVSLVRRWRGSR